MKRFTSATLLASALCFSLLVGFAPSEKPSAEAGQMTIEISSETDTVDFEAQFESEEGFSISAVEGVTPARFTVSAEHFTGTIKAEQGAKISVTTHRGGTTSSATASGVRIVRNGSYSEISPLRPEPGQ
mgnify:CR=1 FL=1